MIIFVRHGERADQVAKNEQNGQILNQFDPNLTIKGEQQAKITGLNLKEIIAQYSKENNFKEEEIQINFMSSPFLRCIQTSIIMMKEIRNNSTLHIQDEISEWMAHFLFKKECQHLLHLRTKQHPSITQEFLNGIKIVEQKYLNSNELIQAKFPENQLNCYQRVSTFITELVNFMEKSPKKKQTINICVTHQGLVQFALQKAKTKDYGYVDYCGVAQLILDEKVGLRVGISGTSFWK